MTKEYWVVFLVNQKGSISLQMHSIHEDAMDANLAKFALEEQNQICMLVHFTGTPTNIIKLW